MPKIRSNPTLKYAHTVALLLCILLSDGLKSTHKAEYKGNFISKNTKHKYYNQIETNQNPPLSRILQRYRAKFPFITTA